MKTVSLVLVLLGVVASGCGSDGGDDGAKGASGVDKSKSLASLSASEKGQLCDWTASVSGGYGKTMMCAGDSEASNDANQAECVASLPSCAITVAQAETCTKVVVTVPLCDQVEKAFTAPECAPLVACVTTARK